MILKDNYLSNLKLCILFKSVFIFFEETLNLSYTFCHRQFFKQVLEFRQSVKADSINPIEQ